MCVGVRVLGLGEPQMRILVWCVRVRVWCACVRRVIDGDLVGLK